jgi:hypothetical protein
MATFAPNQDIETRFEERVREAWDAYKDQLAGLEGRAYDDAEADAWAHLQDTLREIEAAREAHAIASAAG